MNNLKTPGIEVAELFRRTMGDVARASGNKQRPAVYNQFPGIAYLGKAGSAPAPTPVVVPPQPKSDPTPAPVAIPAGFVRIQGGTFTMGSPASEADRFSSEVQHRVTVSGFLMGKHEVTQKEWQEVMGNNPSRFQGDNLPVERVSWYDVVDYYNKRSVKEGLTPAYTIDKSRRDPNNEPL